MSLLGGDADLSEPFVPSDQAHRERIALSLDETLFVEAGAGTGKTTALVSRLVNLVASGRTTIERIAAITFTEAAAAELREKVRHALEERGRSAGAGAPERQRSLEAARRLDHGAIQTLHGFAASLLQELPLEAGLPPEFDAVEEIEADLRFEERWTQMLAEALESQDLAPLLSKALRLGLRLDTLRDIARAFHENYDLLGQPLDAQPAPAPTAATRVAEAREEIRRLLPLAQAGLADPLAAHARGVATLGDRLAALEEDGSRSTTLLARWGRISARNLSNPSNWNDDPQSRVNGCKLMKDLLRDLESARSEELERARRAAILPLLEGLRHLVLDYAEERRTAGKAEFHDLLVWARDLLRDNSEGRAHFQSRFSHILIDEFQDTDPIQAEIAFYLTEQTHRSAKDWTSLKVEPGKLFIVGDAKQSIYRFRRADIGVLGLVKNLLGDSTVPLKQNFRCQEPIISWVNAIFGRWIGGDGDDVQAAYVPLAPRWSPPDANPPLGVHWFGGALGASSGEVRREESTSVASVLRQIQSAAWKVRDEDSGELRDARYRDICVLLPTRTGLRALEQALAEANLPYRVESQSMVLATQDVRELLDCLRAIDAPADQIALVAALRSSAFGCSDVELLQFVESGGNLNYIEAGKGAGEVRDALEVLHSYHQSRTWEDLDLLIERFIRERQMVEACFGSARPRERWRRLRFVVQRARAFAQVSGGSLRAFLDLIERQAREGARMVEAPVPETDEDAVRIMTIHAAKGLEFPIVLLSGLGATPNPRAPTVIFDRLTGGVEVRAPSSYGGHFSTAGFDKARQQEAMAQEAENIRLMYVASTRARDHLIVSLFRPQRSKTSPAAVISDLASDKPELWNEVVVERRAGPEQAQKMTSSEGAADTAATRDAWRRRRREVIREAARPPAAAATRLAQLDKEEADGGEVSYRRGRAGTSLGRAVHSVLQTIDLATGEGVDETSRAQASAEGIPNRSGEVARLVGAALQSPVVKRAIASRRYYREVFVSAPVDGILVEGFIDLLFEADGGLVIVDYKTDAIQGDEEADQARERYRIQVGAYALALAQSTGMPVKEVVLLFLHTNTPVPFEDIMALQSLARQRALEFVSTPQPG